MLRQKEGGEQWLMSLRRLSLEDAVTSLCTLPGIGPKVAACIALFSLDQHHAIPVDTHVWQVCSKRRSGVAPLNLEMQFFLCVSFAISCGLD